MGHYDPTDGAGVLAVDEVEAEGAGVFEVVEAAEEPFEPARTALTTPLELCVTADEAPCGVTEADPTRGAVKPSTFTPLDVNAFRMSTSPLICADCSSERLISRLSVVPFVDLITAGGCGWPAGGTEAAATGMIPSAARAGSELTGSWTGIAVLLIPAA